MLTDRWLVRVGGVLAAGADGPKYVRWPGGGIQSLAIAWVHTGQRCLGGVDGTRPVTNGLGGGGTIRVIPWQVTRVGQLANLGREASMRLCILAIGVESEPNVGSVRGKGKQP